MAQLIKLQDYISRYEIDLSRYPSQFIRLKKQQWKKLKEAWEKGSPSLKDIDQQSEDIEKNGIVEKVFSMFKKEDPAVIVEVTPNREDEELDFTTPLHAQSEAELKQHFLNNLLQFQLKWASSTITEKSFINHRYYEDERLHHYLQRFPDTFLLLYEPVFLLKKAPVELEVLLLTPTGIWCLAFLENEDNAAYIGSNDHFWVKKINNHEEKVLNPVMSARRMEKIVKQLFQLYDVELPIYKAIVSRNAFIDYPDVSKDLVLLDKRSYQVWFQKMRNLTSPFKMMQIKAAKALLDYCQVASFRRPDWNETDE